jgi:hypothetical protein
MTKVTINQKWLNQIEDDLLDGITELANRAAAAASKAAPRSQRQPGKKVTFKIGQRELTKTQMSQLRNQMGSFTDDFKDVEAYTTGHNGKEVLYPRENVVWKTRYGAGRLSTAEQYAEELGNRISAKKNPVTGPHLKNSMVVQVKQKKNKTTATVTANRPYAWYVEKGIAGKGQGKNYHDGGPHYMEAGLASVLPDVEAGRVFKRVSDE